MMREPLAILAVATPVIVTAHRARVPYPIGLVVAGLVLGLLAHRWPGALRAAVRLTPELLLMLLATSATPLSVAPESRVARAELTPGETAIVEALRTVLSYDSCAIAPGSSGMCR